MGIDPSYENRLAGREAWTVQEVARVALDVPLSARSGDAVRESLNLRNQLAKAVESKALGSVECKEPTQARTERVHSANSSTWMGEYTFDPLPFNKAHRTRTVARKTFYHLATVRPLDAAAWLRASGKPGLAARVELVAEALCPSVSTKSLFERIEASDEPRNLSKASPADVDAWIAAQWAAAAQSKTTKGFGEALVKKLQAGGFSKEAARAKHAETVPAEYSRKRKGARFAR